MSQRCETFSEGVRLVFQIVEEAIAAFQSQERVGHDALEGGSDEGPAGRILRDAADEQIHVVHRSVQQPESIHNLNH